MRRLIFVSKQQYNDTCTQIFDVIRMTKLQINFNFLKSVSLQFQDLKVLLSSLDEEIDALDFRYNHLDRLNIDQLSLIASLIPPQVHTLSLYANHLGEKLMFLTLLPRTIRTLDLSHNQFVALSHARASEIMLSMPDSIEHLTLDYQDLSLHIPYFPREIKTLTISRRDDFKEHYDHRKLMFDYVPKSLLYINLEDRLWIYNYQPELGFVGIPRDHHHLILNLSDYRLETIGSICASIPSHIKSLHLDCSDEVLFEFYDLDNDMRHRFLSLFPPTLKHIHINSGIEIQRKGSHRFEYEYSLGFQSRIYQRKMVSRPRFFSLAEVLEQNAAESVFSSP